MLQNIKWKETSAKTWTLGLCDNFWTSDQSCEITGPGSYIEIESVCPILSSRFPFPQVHRWLRILRSDIDLALLVRQLSRQASIRLPANPSPRSPRLESRPVIPLASSAPLSIHLEQTPGQFEVVVGDSTFLRATFHSTTFSRPPRSGAAPLSYHIASPKVALSIHHFSLSNNHLIAASVTPRCKFHSNSSVPPPHRLQWCNWGLRFPISRFPIPNSIACPSSCRGLPCSNRLRNKKQPEPRTHSNQIPQTPQRTLSLLNRTIS